MILSIQGGSPANAGISKGTSLREDPEDASRKLEAEEGRGVFPSLRSNLIPSLAIGQSSPFNLRSLGPIIADNARVSPWTNRVADRDPREKETRGLVVLSSSSRRDVSRMSSRARTRGSAARYIGDSEP
jgi:hypothetical protein